MASCCLCCLVCGLGFVCVLLLLRAALIAAVWMWVCMLFWVVCVGVIGVGELLGWCVYACWFRWDLVCLIL